MRKIYPTNTQKNISTDALAANETHLFPYNPDSSRFILICNRNDYSASRIAHAIEDCNAHVLNLNVTDDVLSDNMIAVDVRVDRKEIASITRSLARYDFMVINSDDSGNAVSENERQRVAELLRYIDL